MTSIEQKSFRVTIGIAMIVSLFLITTTLTIGHIINDINEDISLLEVGMEHHTNAYNVQDERINRLENSNTELKIELATIKTKLSNIEFLILQLREDLKDESEKE